ncbi:C39 family peptidase [Planosporangium sp. 12N6]|uniref:C39 family peptidase n=1 Tax=Planosporangium spinosum TaxID=3402278 RepID=UPI003CF60B90
MKVGTRLLVTALAAGMVGTALVAPGAAYAGPATQSTGAQPAGALPGEDLAAARAARDTEPRPVVSPELKAIIAEKDREANAYVAKKMAHKAARAKNNVMAEAGPATPMAVGVMANHPCPDGDCSWWAISANQQAQVNNYYCGPATLSEAVGARGIGISQYTAAASLGTNSDGTAWYNGSYPMANSLNNYLGSQGAYYAAVNLSGSPSASEKSSYKTRLMSNIDRGWAVAGDAYEYHGYPHLVGHPVDKDIFHWFEIRGYEGYGATTWYEDSVAGASSISWSNKVPAYSSLPSDSIVTIMGGRGYVW